MDYIGHRGHLTCGKKSEAMPTRMCDRIHYQTGENEKVEQSAKRQGRRTPRNNIKTIEETQGERMTKRNRLR